MLIKRTVNFKKRKAIHIVLFVGSVFVLFLFMTGIGFVFAKYAHHLSRTQEIVIAFIMVAIFIGFNLFFFQRSLKDFRLTLIAEEAKQFALLYGKEYQMQNKKKFFYYMLFTVMIIAIMVCISYFLHGNVIFFVLFFIAIVGTSYSINAFVKSSYTDIISFVNNKIPHTQLHLDNSVVTIQSKFGENSGKTHITGKYKKRSITFTHQWNTNTQRIFMELHLNTENKLYATGTILERDFLWSAIEDKTVDECFLKRFILSGFKNQELSQECKTHLLNYHRTVSMRLSSNSIVYDLKLPKSTSALLPFYSYEGIILMFNFFSQLADQLPRVSCGRSCLFFLFENNGRVLPYPKT
ncbi:MAG TPA: hypothetical protein VJB65_02285 [Patescibacteria group bacterium]|nr:hypothetical protein [Patescibacteria group bacterium]